MSSFYKGFLCNVSLNPIEIIGAALRKFKVFDFLTLLAKSMFFTSNSALTADPSVVGAPHRTLINQSVTTLLLLIFMY